MSGFSLLAATAYPVACAEQLSGLMAPYCAAADPEDPNLFWLSYELGGWAPHFLAPAADKPIEDTAPAGYQWCCTVQKGNIAWEAMRELAKPPVCYCAYPYDTDILLAPDGTCRRFERRMETGIGNYAEMWFQWLTQIQNFLTNTPDDYYLTCVFCK